MRVELNTISGSLASSGIGDLRLFAKYLVYQNEPNGTQLAPDWTISLGTRILFF